MLHRKDLEAFMGIDAALLEAARNPNRSQPVPLIDQDSQNESDPPPGRRAVASAAEPPQSEPSAPGLFAAFNTLAWMGGTGMPGAFRRPDRDDTE